MAGFGARVLVALRISPQGEVEAAEIAQSAMYDVEGRPRVLADALARFEAVCLREARRWRFDVTVPAGMTPSAEQMTAYVPVIFHGTDFQPPRPGEWRLVVRTPGKEPSWYLPDPTRLPMGVADVGGNGPTKAEDDVRLRSSVAGQVL
jgi:hypothetical protein